MIMSDRFPETGEYIRVSKGYMRVLQARHFFVGAIETRLSHKQD